MQLNPATQYATDANLRARQRLWEAQRPPFDLIGWVLGLADLDAGTTADVLDVGCGNGRYVHELRRRGITATGCDLARGMLEAAGPHRPLVAADVTRLPLASQSFDVVLAPHMLYHVPDRATAASELRRVLRPGGRCVIGTNGARHMAELRSLIEAAVGSATPGWEMRNPATHAFSLQNGAAQLRRAFTTIDCVVASGAPPVRVTDASIVADYVASIADHYESQTSRPWSEVVDDVRAAAQDSIDRTGEFVVRGESGAFVCT